MMKRKSHKINFSLLPNPNARVDESAIKMILDHAPIKPSEIKKTKPGLVRKRKTGK